MQTDFMGISFTLIEVIHTSHTMALQNQMKHQSYFYYFDKFLFIIVYIYLFIKLFIYRNDIFITIFHEKFVLLDKFTYFCRKNKDLL